MKKHVFPDVLALRYGSAPMVLIWGELQKIIDERQFWIREMRDQKDLGMYIPQEVIDAYAAVADKIDLDAIATLEEKLRHDVLARIRTFNELASKHLGQKTQRAHDGNTSRDLDDNLAQSRIMRSALLIRDKNVSMLARLKQRAIEYALLDMVGRSHLAAGQTTTLGKRFATIAEESLKAFARFEHLIEGYTFRGIKGAMGTQQDMIDRLGSVNKAIELDIRMAKYLNAPSLFVSTGQVYPRSLDFDVAAALVYLSSPLGNFATMVRLLAGFGLMHEGFGEGQAASSAMPHKRNTRTAERVKSLSIVVRGFMHMLSELCGDQWLEGDVSDSAVRRVALPGMFLALDGLYEAALTVLDEMEVFPNLIGAELQRFHGYLSSTAFLTAATQKGMGREDAYDIIKKHARASLQSGNADSFITSLGQDEEFPVTPSEIDRLLGKPNHGAAETQVERVVEMIDEVLLKYPAAVNYKPEPIL